MNWNYKFSAVNTLYQMLGPLFFPKKKQSYVSLRLLLLFCFVSFRKIHFHGTNHAWIREKSSLLFTKKLFEHMANMRNAKSNLLNHNHIYFHVRYHSIIMCLSFFIIQHFCVCIRIILHIITEISKWFFVYSIEMNAWASLFLFFSLLPIPCD